MDNDYVLCSNCEFMTSTCSKSRLYAAGFINGCPYTDKAIIDHRGVLMNASFNERIDVNKRLHILFFPEKIYGAWILKWILTIDGAGSCGTITDSIYLLAFKKAIDDILKSERLSETEKMAIKSRIKNRGKLDMTGFSFKKIESDEIIVEEKPVKKKQEPFKDFVYGKIGDQLDLF